MDIDKMAFIDPSVGDKNAAAVRRKMLIFVMNFYPVFYPIRTERHVFLQCFNTAVHFMRSSWMVRKFDAAEVVMRAVFALSSWVIVFALEAMSRRDFSLGLMKPLSAEQRVAMAKLGGLHHRQEHRQKLRRGDSAGDGGGGRKEKKKVV